MPVALAPAHREPLPAARRSPSCAGSTTRPRGCCARLVAVSEDTRRAYERQGYPRGRIEVVYNGVEPAAPPAEREPARGARDPRRRAARRRGRAALRREGPARADRGARAASRTRALVLVGDDLEQGGAYQAGLEQEAERLGVRDRVVFAGYRDDAARRCSPSSTSSRCRRGRRACRSSCSRRWRARGRSSRRRSAARPSSSWTARPGLLVPPRDPDGARGRAAAAARRRRPAAAARRGGRAPRRASEFSLEAMTRARCSRSTTRSPRERSPPRSRRTTARRSSPRRDRERASRRRSRDVRAARRRRRLDRRHGGRARAVRRPHPRRAPGERRPLGGAQHRRPRGARAAALVPRLRRPLAARTSSRARCRCSRPSRARRHGARARRRDRRRRARSSARRPSATTSSSAARNANGVTYAGCAFDCRCFSSALTARVEAIRGRRRATTRRSCSTTTTSTSGSRSTGRSASSRGPRSRSTATTRAR